MAGTRKWQSHEGLLLGESQRRRGVSEGWESRARESPLNLWKLLANSTAGLQKTEFVFPALGLNSVKIFGLYLRSFVFPCKH